MSTLRAGSVTDTGRARAVNQDSLLVVDGRLYAVADGMGGHRGGEVASALALESLAGNVREPSTSSLVAGVDAANQAVHGRSSNEPELRGMGTTLVAIALVVGVDGQERLAMANVGDSRAYRLRDGALEQLTEDHSLVESLVRQGRITPEEAATHPQRNIITRALGVDPSVEVDSWELPIVTGDRFLLCSDGLFNEVDSATIAATLGRFADPDEAAQELARLANEGGGRDNITCVIVDVLDGPGSAGEPVVRVDTASEPDLAGYGPPTAPQPVSVFEDDPLPPSPPASARDPGPPPPPPPLTPAEPTGEAPALFGALPDHLPDDAAEPPPPRRPRRFTWRVAVFIVALLGVVGAVLGALYYNARSTYYVAFNGNDRVTIFRGRPGGFLGIDPTVEQVTTISATDLRDTAVESVRAQSDQASVDEAQQFIDNLCQQLRIGASPQTCADTTTTTTSTTTTSSTIKSGGGRDTSGTSGGTGGGGAVAPGFGTGNDATATTVKRT